MSDWAEIFFISMACFALGVVCFFSGTMYGSTIGERDGYCQALADIEAGKKPMYELKRQGDGTTKWEVRNDGTGM